MNKINIIPNSYLSLNNQRIVFIDGNTCDTLDKCYITLKQQLSIPDYFGFNLDALEEVFSDLDWIEESGVNIVILNEPYFLINDMQNKEVFMEILKENDNEMISVTILS